MDHPMMLSLLESFFLIACIVLVVIEFVVREIVADFTFPRPTSCSIVSVAQYENEKLRIIADVHVPQGNWQRQAGAQEDLMPEFLVDDSIITRLLNALTLANVMLVCIFLIKLSAVIMAGYGCVWLILQDYLLVSSDWKRMSVEVCAALIGGIKTIEILFRKELQVHARTVIVARFYFTYICMISIAWLVIALLFSTPWHACGVVGWGILQTVYSTMTSMIHLLETPLHAVISTLTNIIMWLEPLWLKSGTTVMTLISGFLRGLVMFFSSALFNLAALFQLITAIGVILSPPPRCNQFAAAAADCSPRTIVEWILSGEPIVLSSLQTIHPPLCALFALLIVQICFVTVYFFSSTLTHPSFASGSHARSAALRDRGYVAWAVEMIEALLKFVLISQNREGSRPAAARPHAAATTYQRIVAALLGGLINLMIVISFAVSPYFSLVTWFFQWYFYARGESFAYRIMGLQCLSSDGDIPLDLCSMIAWSISSFFFWFIDFITLCTCCSRTVSERILNAKVVQKKVFV